MFRELEMSIGDAIRQASKHEELAYLSGEPSLGYDENDEPVAGSSYDLLEKIFRQAYKQVQELRVHAHEWDDHGFCNYCGADGNA